MRNAECGMGSAQSRNHESPITHHPSLRQICTVNPEFIVDAGRDPAFAAVLRRADLRVPDGVGVLWAARRLGRPLRERVTGSDGIYRITQHAADKGYRVFFLGAGPGVAMQTALRLRTLYPQLIVPARTRAARRTLAGRPLPAGWRPRSPTFYSSPTGTPSRNIGSTGIATNCRWRWRWGWAGRLISWRALRTVRHTGCSGWDWNGCIGSCPSPGAGGG